MLIKAGVDISRLKRETRRGLGLVGKVFRRHGQEVVVTSTFEGNHGEGSLHYGNEAFSIGYSEIENFELIREIRKELGNDFDVVEKDNYIDIEHDPEGS